MAERRAAAKKTPAKGGKNDITDLW
jgi:hypothetical protein